MKNIILTVLILSLTACASSSGFDRGSLRSSMKHGQEITDSDIQKAFETKPQLSSPFKLAIYTELSHWKSSWDTEDKNELSILEANLIKANVVTDVVYLNQTMIEGYGKPAIRLAAARAGADAVLIINGSGSIDKYNNLLGATYFLIVTPFFVPGTVADGLFLLSGSMWDVRNEYLYLSVEAEATASQTMPAFLIKEQHVLNEAKTKAVHALREALESKLLAMKKER